MKSYLESILTVLLVGSLSSVLMPEGEGRRFVRFALSILVLAAVMSPFRTGEVVRFLSSYTPNAFEEQVKEGEAYLLEREEKAIEEGLSSSLAERYGLSHSLIALDADCVAEKVGEGRTVRVSFVRLHLYGRACMADVPSMVKTIQSELSAECEVIYHR